MYCVYVCTYEPCAACLRLILTFPTGAGVNKAANHSRCGEQTWEQGRSASLQPQATVKSSRRSQYLPLVSKPALFFVSKTRLYRSKLVHESRRCLGCYIQQLHWRCKLVIFREISIKPLHRNLNVVGVALIEPFSLSCLTKTLVNRTFKGALVKICI